MRHYRFPGTDQAKAERYYTRIDQLKADAKIAREARVLGAIAALDLTGDQSAHAHSEVNCAPIRHRSQSAQAPRTSRPISGLNLRAVIATARQLSTALRSKSRPGGILPEPMAQERHEKLQSQSVSFGSAVAGEAGFENPTAAADAAHRLSENRK